VCWTSEQNPSLLTRFIGTIKQSWSRRGSVAVSDLLKTPTESLSTPVWQTPRLTAAERPRDDLVNDRGAHAYDDGHHQSTELWQVHRLLVNRLEPPRSDYTSKFSASRFAVINDRTIVITLIHGGGALPRPTQNFGSMGHDAFGPTNN